MNQILNSSKYDDIQKINKKNIKKKYKIIFIFSIIFILISIIILIINIFSYAEKEKISKGLLSSFNITKLYSNNTTNSTTSITTKNKTDPFVIGIIQIEKINLNYPILSTTTRDLLKVSLCRYIGPLPNEIGNLCIVGHNLVDYKLFSRLNEIEINDKIKIYDLTGKLVEYKVFKKYEVFPTDVSCLSQNTNGNKIITLITCNNVNGKRLVITAK